MVTYKFHSSSPEDTQKIAQDLSTYFGAGDVILLTGPIGAGKSLFSRALIQSYMARSSSGVIEDVPSPSFTLVQSYEIDGLEIWHVDLYRLSDPSEVEELGLFDAFATSLVLIEWPERLAGEYPSTALSIRFETLDQSEERRLFFEGDESWAKRFAKFEAKE